MPAYASASLRNLCPFRVTPHRGAGSSRREPFGCFNPQPAKENTANIPPAPSGCSTARKGNVAANLQRFASALAEIQSKPLQPEPPSTAAAKQTTHREKRGDRGESTILLSPRRLCAAFDARKRPPAAKQSSFAGKKNLHKFKFIAFIPPQKHTKQ